MTTLAPILEEPRKPYCEITYEDSPEFFTRVNSFNRHNEASGTFFLYPKVPLANFKIQKKADYFLFKDIRIFTPHEDFPHTKLQIASQLIKQLLKTTYIQLQRFSLKIEASGYLLHGCLCEGLWPENSSIVYPVYGTTVEQFNTLNPRVTHFSKRDFDLVSGKVKAIVADRLSIDLSKVDYTTFRKNWYWDNSTQPYRQAYIPSFVRHHLLQEGDLNKLGQIVFSLGDREQAIRTDLLKKPSFSLRQKLRARYDIAPCKPFVLIATRKARQRPVLCRAIENNDLITYGLYSLSREKLLGTATLASEDNTLKIQEITLDKTEPYQGLEEIFIKTGLLHYFKNSYFEKGILCSSELFKQLKPFLSLEEEFSALSLTRSSRSDFVNISHECLNSDLSFIHMEQLLTLLKAFIEYKQLPKPFDKSYQVYNSLTLFLNNFLGNIASDVFDQHPLVRKKLEARSSESSSASSLDSSTTSRSSFKEDPIVRTVSMVCYTEFPKVLYGALYLTLSVSNLPGLKIEMIDLPELYLRDPDLYYEEIKEANLLALLTQ